MSKVTLVSPNERKYLSSAGDRMPLGVLYLATALNANGIENECIDMNHTPWLDTIERIKTDKPDVVGLSLVSSLSYPQMKRLAQEIRPFTDTIVAGGHHMSALPHSLDGLVDAVVTADGENGIVKVAKGWKGVIRQEFDINEFPIPDRTKLDASKYGLEILGLKTAPMTTMRGCPFGCIFCGNMNDKPKFREAGNIEEEVQQIKKMGYEGVYFYNESHTLNKGHATEVGEIMKRNKLKYRVETRANLITDETAKMLSDTGCMMVALGVESGDDKVLEAIHKGETTEQIRNAVSTLSYHGVPTKGYFIMGLPEQDLESGLKSIDFAKQLQTDGMRFADFYALTPFPGSPIAKNPDKYGVRVLDDNYKHYLEAGRKSITPVVETDWLSREGIKALIERARIEWNR